MKENDNKNIDSTKRAFIKKFGSYAATAPVGMYMLMTPSSSAAHTSGHSHRKHCHMGNGNHGNWPWRP